MDFADLFTPRQVTALTTFSDLVHEARELATRDALAATPLGPPEESGGGQAVKSPPDSSGGDLEGGKLLREGGRGARAYGEAVSVYLAHECGASRLIVPLQCAFWDRDGEKVAASVCTASHSDGLGLHGEANPFSDSSGNFLGQLKYTVNSRNYTRWDSSRRSLQDKMTRIVAVPRAGLFSTDPPYYDNIGYADLSDFLLRLDATPLRGVQFTPPCIWYDARSKDCGTYCIDSFARALKRQSKTPL